MDGHAEYFRDRQGGQQGDVHRFDAPRPGCPKSVRHGLPPTPCRARSEVGARGVARSAGPARRRPFALRVDHATGRVTAPSIGRAETTITSFIAAATAIVLSIAAGGRGIQDLPLLGLAARDALYAGVLGTAAVPLRISPALGLAAP